METKIEVYKAINAVSQAMAREGIAKNSKNQSQGYAFRGIDACLTALAPHLAEQKLCILPRVMSRTVTERETKSGGVLFYTTLMVEFDFVSAIDGSKHTVCTAGEAMDSGDKSTNKAMSAAYKYAALQAFCIPTEGDNDADAHSPAPVPAQRQASNQPPVASIVPISEANKTYLETVAKSDEDGKALIANVLTKTGAKDIASIPEHKAVKAVAWVKEQLDKTTPNPF